MLRPSLQDVPCQISGIIRDMVPTNFFEIPQPPTWGILILERYTRKDPCSHGPNNHKSKKRVRKFEYTWPRPKLKVEDPPWVPWTFLAPLNRGQFGLASLCEPVQGPKSKIKCPVLRQFAKNHIFPL